jgi:hypothetical protein
MLRLNVLCAYSFAEAIQVQEAMMGVRQSWGGVFVYCVSRVFRFSNFFHSSFQLTLLPASSATDSHWLRDNRCLLVESTYVLRCSNLEFYVHSLLTIHAAVEGRHHRK